MAFRFKWIWLLWHWFVAWSCWISRVEAEESTRLLLFEFFFYDSLTVIPYMQLFSYCTSFCFHLCNLFVLIENTDWTWCSLSLSFFLSSANQTPVVHNIKKHSIEFQKGLCILNPENYLCKNLILSLFRIENSVTLSLHLPTEDVRWLTACVQLTPDWNLNRLNVAMTIL